MARLRVNHFRRNNRILLLEEVQDLTDLPISLATYMRICEALQAHFGVRTNAIRGNGTAVKIDTFLNSFKKGSKQVRNIIASTRSKNHSPENITK